MSEKSSFNKYSNNIKFGNHNYTESGLFNFGRINTPKDNLNDLQEYIGASLDHFKGINTSNNMINQFISTDMNYWDNPIWHSPEGYEHKTIPLKEYLDIAVKARTTTEMIPLLEGRYLNNDATLDGIQYGSSIVEGVTRIREDYFELDEASVHSELKIDLLSEVPAPLINDNKYFKFDGPNDFTGDYLEVLNKGSAVMQADNFDKFKYDVASDLRSLDLSETDQVWQNKINAQFQNTKCLTDDTVYSKIWDAQKVLKGNISRFETNNPILDSEPEEYPSVAIEFSDITDTANLIPDDPSFLAGIADKHESKIAVNSFNESVFYSDRGIIDTDSILYPNNSLSSQFQCPKASIQTCNLISGFNSDLEKPNHVNHSLVSFDNNTKDNFISRFSDISMSSQKKIDGIVQDILPEQVGQVEFGVSLSAEQNNYTLNIFVFVDGDISGDKPQIGHIFNIN